MTWQTRIFGATSIVGATGARQTSSKLLVAFRSSHFTASVAILFILSQRRETTLTRAKLFFSRSARKIRANGCQSSQWFSESEINDAARVQSTVSRMEKPCDSVFRWKLSMNNRKSEATQRSINAKSDRLLILHRLKGTQFFADVDVWQCEGLLAIECLFNKLYNKNGRKTSNLGNYLVRVRSLCCFSIRKAFSEVNASKSSNLMRISIQIEFSVILWFKSYCALTPVVSNKFFLNFLIFLNKTSEKC